MPKNNLMMVSDSSFFPEKLKWPWKVISTTYHHVCMEDYLPDPQIHINLPKEGPCEKIQEMGKFRPIHTTTRHRFHSSRHPPKAACLGAGGLAAQCAREFLKRKFSVGCGRQSARGFNQDLLSCFLSKQRAPSLE